LLFTQRGTPGIYQGDEIGMTNTPFGGIEDYRDVDTLNFYRDWRAEGRDMDKFIEDARSVSRDHARTPILWSNSPKGGFTTGQPWIMVNPNYTEINVAAALADPDSIFHYYKRLIQFRRKRPVLIYGSTKILLDAGETPIYAFEREWEGEKYLIVLNFGSEEQAVPLRLAEGDPALSNYADPFSPEKLRPWEVRVYKPQNSKM
jgi:oligo-1,6-glucosidase